MSRSLELALGLCLTLAACGGSDSQQNDERNPDAAPTPVANPGPENAPGTGEAPPPASDPAPAPLPGISSKNATYRFDVEWIAGPDFEDEDNQARLYFFTPGGKPASAVVLEKFYPWMTSMGHGAPTIDLEWDVEDPARPHVFVVKGLMFTMGGDWDLMVDAVVNGTADKAAFAVEVPK